MLMLILIPFLVLGFSWVQANKGIPQGVRAVTTVIFVAVMLGYFLFGILLAG